MMTRVMWRSVGAALVAATGLGFLAPAGQAQSPPLPGLGGPAPLQPGSSFPMPGLNSPAGSPSPAATLPQTPGPHVKVPALKTPSHASVAPSQTPPAAATNPGAVRVTLDEAKQRTLANNKLLQLGNLNAESKAFAVRAAQADYFPKVTGTALYLHFNDDLGTVLTTQRRTLSGPLGRPLVTFPPTSTAVAVLNQDTSLALLNATQPLTDLLKVRQGVKIARADQEIARLEVEKGIRDLVSGVEQLYWGLLAIHKLRAGALEGVAGAEMMAKGGDLEARVALVEAKQGLQQVEKQGAEIQEQLNALLDLPLCTPLELVEPPLPIVPVACAEDAAGLAVSVSPEVRQAHQTILKAQAAVKAGKLDFVPSIAAVGGLANQTAANYMQESFGYVGLVGTITFVDWGKRRNVIQERNTMLSMATLKLHQTQDEVRQKAAKAFREVQEDQAALRTAVEMAGLRKQAEKQANTPQTLLAAARARGLAEVEAVKAELAYRQSCVKLLSLLNR